MKRRFLILFLMFFVAPVIAQDVKKIPVFPGATLVVPKDDTEADCCDFSTTAPMSKVVIFYEENLKTKALDTKALKSKYPALKQHFEELEGQLPEGAQYKAFVLEEIDMKGEKGANVFELTGFATTVKFSIQSTALNGQDMHYALEWQDMISGIGPEIKPVSWKKLATFLPAIKLKGFQREEVIGENLFEGQFPESSASVQYTRQIKTSAGEDEDVKTIEITVTITDFAGNAEYAQDMIECVAETDKPVKVKNAYEGRESREINESGYESVTKAFLIKNRYLVEVICEGASDMQAINKLINSMKLTKLEKTE